MMLRIFAVIAAAPVLLAAQGTDCTYVVTPTTLVYPAAGGSLTVTIQTGVLCAWSISGLSSILTGSASAGAGPATVTLTAAPHPNTGAGQYGIVIAGITVNINQTAPLSITAPSTLPAATAGSPYSLTLGVEGGLQPLTWSLSSGMLPPGITISAPGILSGAATAGAYRFALRVTDASAASSVQGFDLTVIGAGATAAAGSIQTTRIVSSLNSVVDSDGNTYSISTGTSTTQGTPGAAQTQPGGGTCVRGFVSTGPCFDAWIRKTAPDGTLLFGTLLGGPADDSAKFLALDAAHNIYIFGQTGGSFPTTPGSAMASSTTSGWFAAKLSADGSKVVYATYLPDTINVPFAFTADPAGNAYAAGALKGGAGFILKLTADGSAIAYNTTFPANSDVHAIAADASGSVIAAGGTDSASFPTTPGALQTTPPSTFSSYLVKLDPAGHVAYATYFPALGASVVQLDSAGNVYVAGQVTTRFAATPGSFEPAYHIPLWSSGGGFGFVQVAPDLGSIRYATYLIEGGIAAVAVNAAGEAYLLGTAVQGLPVTASAPQPCFGGQQDMFVVHLDTRGALLDSTYFGGPRIDSPTSIALADDGSVLVDGYTEAQDVVAARIRFGGPEWFAPACMTQDIWNAASQIFTNGIVAGEFVTLSGIGIGPETGVAYQARPDGQIPTSLGGVQVFFDGHPAPVLYAQSRQVNVEAPFEISGSTVVTLTYNQTTFGPFTKPVILADPEIFRLQPDVSVQALAFNQDNTLNGPSNPAARGSVIYFFGTGFGPTSPGCATGGPNVPIAANLTLGNIVVNSGAAPVQYSGSAPILPCGVGQVNMLVPVVTPGPYGINLVLRRSDGTSYPGSAGATVYVK